MKVKEDSLLNEAVKTDEPTARPDLASWFGVELDALGGKFVLCEEGEVLHTILEILSKRGIDEILSWEDKLLPSNLIQKLSGSCVRIVHPTAENILRCSQVRAGLTGAAAGIADTGSLMLVGGVGRPLITSLLPEIHIALLQEKDLYHHLEPVLQMKAVREAPAAVLITGPSRTADIEMTLTIGVHGPGELYVICIKNE
jgi:L-lactate dehydrogenase complex protein LldG